MDIMTRIITTIQTGAIPIMAVIMAIVVVNMMKKKGKTKTTDDNNFVVTESFFWLVIAVFGVLAAAVLIWMGVGHANLGQSIAAYIMAGICLAVTIATTYAYMKRKLTVKGSTLTFQPLWGKAVTYEAKTIGRVDMVESPRCEEFRFYNRSGKKLFEIQGYMINSKALIKYMRQYPVKISKVAYDASNPKK
ncbi:MAG: hypothetical protein PHG07_08300 [Lachnospiraceae bacterium]|nr:hypothetical protein [Lachnospiraceae bacterium]